MIFNFTKVKFIRNIACLIVGGTHPKGKLMKTTAFHDSNVINSRHYPWNLMKGTSRIVRSLPFKPTV